MTKIITVQGCKDCPYLRDDFFDPNEQCCVKYNFMFDVEPPETPHPDCKLNDLPSDIEIKTSSKLSNANMISDEKERLLNGMGFYEGANYVINQITK